MCRSKVGIITLYKVRNIGACLQAYAMMNILNSLGMEAEFIICYGKEMAKQLFYGDMGTIRPWNIVFQISKELKFRSFFRIFKECHANELKENGIDRIIVGSDSVWISHYGMCFMPDIFFGDIGCDRLYSYATSVGGEYSLSTYNNMQIESLKKFKQITVRDYQTKCFVKEITGQDVPIVVDPTLLYDWDKFIRKTKKPKNIDLYGKYILVYGGITKDYINAVKQYAEKNKLKIINVGLYNRRFKKNIAVSPDEFLHYVYNAEMIITSMFHGVMLSIALRKNFRFLSLSKDRTVKLETIMSMLDLGENQIVTNVAQLNNLSFMNKNIEYDSVYKKLLVYRAESMNYIKSFLK